jgi:hypothetical protein
VRNCEKVNFQEEFNFIQFSCCFIFVLSFVKAHTKLSKGNEVIAYYANNTWEFDNTSCNVVRGLMNETEKEIYKCDSKGIDVEKYFANCFLGARRYLLNEKDETLPRSRRLLKMYV